MSVFENAVLYPCFSDGSRVPSTLTFNIPPYLLLAVHTQRLPLRNYMSLLTHATIISHLQPPYSPYS